MWTGAFRIDSCIDSFTHSGATPLPIDRTMDAGFLTARATTTVTPSRLGVGRRRVPVDRARAEKSGRVRRSDVVVVRASDDDESSSSSVSSSVTLERGDTVVVIGASGGVGQLVAARCAEAGFDVRAVTRSDSRRDALEDRDGTLAAKVTRISGVDCRDPASIAASGAFDGKVDAVVCCLGTTAFPSARWRDEDGKWTNGPEPTDYESTRNVVDAAKRANPELKRFVMVSSVGVLRTNVMPFLILNAFGVLKHKRRGEEHLERSGLPYTILRPGRLTDGPYTSYDLNTLLKATSGTKRAVQIGGGDDVLLPEATSRLVVAEAACAALQTSGTARRAYELGTTEGDGPGRDLDAWTALFATV